MRTITFAAATVFLVGTAFAQAPTHDDEKTLYALGVAIGKGLTNFNLTKAELEVIKRGLTDQVTGAKAAQGIDVKEYGPKFEALQKERSTAASNAYLAKAAKEKGAQVLPSGLIYTELKAGKGAQPKATDVVKVHYRGTLTNGTEFDSSYSRGQPAEFPLNGVIACWTEGVQKIKTGGKARLVCPSKIAYGDRGSPPTIPPGATLIFEVELLEVVKK